MNTIKSELVANYKLTLIQEQNETVNGLPSLAFIGDIVNEADGSKTRLMTYLIKYNNMVYLFHGISAQASFSKYSSLFKTTFESFKKLTDASKINVKPERIKIATVKSAGTLSQALKQLNAPQARYNELAIINGMLLTDKVTAGMLIKTIGQ